MLLVGCEQSSKPIPVTEGGQRGKFRQSVISFSWGIHTKELYQKVELSCSDFQGWWVIIVVLVNTMDIPLFPSVDFLQRTLYLSGLFTLDIRIPGPQPGPLGRQSGSSLVHIQVRTGMTDFRRKKLSPRKNDMSHRRVSASKWTHSLQVQVQVQQSIRLGWFLWSCPLFFFRRHKTPRKFLPLFFLAGFAKNLLPEDTF